MESFTQPTQPLLETLNSGYVTGLKTVQTYHLDGAGAGGAEKSNVMHACYDQDYNLPEIDA